MSFLTVPRSPCPADHHSPRRRRRNGTTSINDSIDVIDLTEDEYEEVNIKRVRFDLTVTPTPPPSPQPEKGFYLVVLCSMATSFIVLQQDWPGVVRDCHLELWRHQAGTKPPCVYFAKNSGYRYLGVKHLSDADIHSDLGAYVPDDTTEYDSDDTILMRD